MISIATCVYSVFVLAHVYLWSGSCCTYGLNHWNKNHFICGCPPTFIWRTNYTHLCRPTTNTTPTSRLAHLSLFSPQVYFWSTLFYFFFFCLFCSHTIFVCSQWYWWNTICSGGRYSWARRLVNVPACLSEFDLDFCSDISGSPKQDESDGRATPGRTTPGVDAMYVNFVIIHI